ncbi:hypothetical protein SALWKB12_1532 [Snodgrassella communis]|uniref:Uncharacterized protein n=1 Tax=Snodgrassella communis TaxID=2946699 RepID=A0A836Z2C5_9NEIS|nr:hypothetical protein SALWKB12_1532 [Snodgrassella communis]KDN13943.1 hypothetical protein SALWKB29_2014 [Snodgrassella communis]
MAYVQAGWLPQMKQWLNPLLAGYNHSASKGNIAHRLFFSWFTLSAQIADKLSSYICKFYLTPLKSIPDN